MAGRPPGFAWLARVAAALCLVTSLLLSRLLYQVVLKPVIFRTCQKKTNIGFLKTHKCASSSVQNILMRFGLKNELNFVLPSAGNYVGR